MKASTSSAISAKSTAGQSRPLVLTATAFALGAVLTGLWFHQREAASAANGTLSAPTQNVLGKLPSAATIHFYSLLPAGTADASLQAFAGRVTDLLTEMQASSGGKLQVVHFDTPADTNINAATAEGLQAFNLEKGDACYLGVSITSGKNQETFARLNPQWEPALQYDLARAIERVTALPPAPKPAPEVAKPSPEIISSVHELIPDVAATSVADADRIFHNDFMKQCMTAGQKFQEEINAATEKVTAAHNSGSTADEDAARKSLQERQLAQGEKLKAFATRMQLQLAVFQQMKDSATNTAK